MNAELDRDTRNKKQGQLGSSFGLGDNEPRAQPTWNKTEQLVNPSTGWNSSNNASSTQNKGKIDPFKQRQNQLASGVFEQTDHSAHIPITKHDINTNDFQAQKIKTDGARPKTDINHFDRKNDKKHDYRDAKQSNLRSAFDEGREYTRAAPQEDYKPSPVKGSNANQSKKLQNLTTTNNLPGADANAFYNKSQNKGEVIDLVLSGLDSSVQQADLKKISNVKHVISSEVDLDALKGTCKGTGRIKIRLNEGEDPETIRQNFINKGILVQGYKNEPSKKSDFTRPRF